MHNFVSTLKNDPSFIGTLHSLTAVFLVLIFASTCTHQFPSTHIQQKSNLKSNKILKPDYLQNYCLKLEIDGVYQYTNWIVLICSMALLAGKTPSAKYKTFRPLFKTQLWYNSL